MKFLAAFILSISLMATSSFAVSLTPPMVLKMQEDRTMATNIDTTDKDPFSFRNLFILSMSVPLVFSGLLITLIGAVQIGDDNYNQSDAKIGIGAGVGMTVLGAGGLIFISYF